MTTFLQLHSAEVSSSFGREAFGLRHELVAHPLLGLEPLAELADSSTPDEVERNSATCPLGLGWRLSRSQRERTGREDRRSKFYEIPDNLP